MVDICPHCHRRLLSHASACCNWCGEVIPDEQYQQDAATNREAFYAQERMHEAIDQARIDAIAQGFGLIGSAMGPLGPTPIMGGSPWSYAPPVQPTVPMPPKPQSPAPVSHPEPLFEETPNGDSESGVDERFGHLEL